MKAYVLLFLLLSYTAPCWSEKIIVVVGEYCPYVCMNQKKSGIFIEVLNRVFPAPEFELLLRERPWTRSLLEASNGDVHVVSAAGGRNSFDFLLYVDAPIFRDRLCFYGLSHLAWRYEGYDSLQEVSIGVMNNYVYPHPLDNIYKDREVRKVIINDTGVQIGKRMIKMMLSRRFDIGVNLESITDYVLSKNKWQKDVKNLGCLSEVYEEFIAFSRNTPNVDRLLQRFNNRIIKLRKNGELKNILSQYGISQ